MRKIALILFIFLVGCGGQESQSPNVSTLQGETYLLERFAVQWVDVEKCPESADCPEGAVTTKYYVSIEVDSDVMNKFRQGDVIPTESLVVPGLTPYQQSDNEKGYYIPIR